MLPRLLILLLITAVAEAAVLVWLVKRAGFFETIAILLAAGFVGTLLARWQGLRAWRAIRADIAAGRPPAAGVVDGVLVLLAGLLLLLPGLLTDLCGILLLVPQVRALVRPALLASLTRRLSVRFRDFATRSGGRGEIIDAEFRRADAPGLEDRR